MQPKSNNTYYKLDNSINLIDKDLPIKLTKIEHLIDTVSNQYPGLKKSEISFIVKTFFEEIREQLLHNNVISINDLFFNMKLYTYCKLTNNKIKFNTRVQLTTPRHIKQC